jgi:hypothetical protein
MYMIRDRIRPTPESQMPLVLGLPPTPWWGEDEDRDLLIGTLKYGYQQYAEIASDSSLCFAKRLGISAQFVNGTESIETEDNMESTDLLNGDDEGVLQESEDSLKNSTMTDLFKPENQNGLESNLDLASTTQSSVDPMLVDNTNANTTTIETKDTVMTDAIVAESNMSDNPAVDINGGHLTTEIMASSISAPAPIESAPQELPPHQNTLPETIQLHTTSEGNIGSTISAETSLPPAPTENEPIYIFPSASDCGIRIRKLIAAFIRYEQNLLREELRRQAQEERIKAKQEREDERLKQKERELTKRDRLGILICLHIIYILFC